MGIFTINVPFPNWFSSMLKFRLKLVWFRIISQISTSNIYLIQTQKKICKYTNAICVYLLLSDTFAWYMYIFLKKCWWKDIKIVIPVCETQKNKYTNTKTKFQNNIANEIFLIRCGYKNKDKSQNILPFPSVGTPNWGDGQNFGKCSHCTALHWKDCFCLSLNISSQLLKTQGLVSPNNNSANP